MRLLVLGGTVFLGRHLVEQALERGHRVTLFHRGRHGADLFPAAERVLGDRDGGLDALPAATWDAAVDTCGYVPRVVRASARRLAGAVDRYLFVSTVSVYADESVPGRTEDAPVGRLADPAVEKVDGETYGPLKALCEEAAEAEMPGRVLVVRPGLIVGPHDPSDRFTYWPVRVARGGEVLAPERPSVRTQFVDVRDLAGWMLDLLESRRTGTIHATGPGRVTGLGEVLDACRRAAGSDARFTWVDRDFLAAEGVAPYVDLPLWVPDTPEYGGFATLDLGRALAAGLRFRPLGETVEDTLAWARSLPPDRPWRAGLAPDREALLLSRFHARSDARSDAGPGAPAAPPPA